jgi:hypothetical protein
MAGVAETIEVARNARDFSLRFLRQAKRGKKPDSYTAYNSLDKLGLNHLYL